MTQNIFEEFSSDPVEFNMKELKAKLLIVLVTMIRQKGWTQSDAAKELGVSQPRISNLFKAHIEKFSIDTLIEMLVRIGYKVVPTFDPANAAVPMRMELKRAAL